MNTVAIYCQHEHWPDRYINSNLSPACRCKSDLVALRQCSYDRGLFDWSHMHIHGSRVRTSKREYHEYLSSQHWTELRRAALDKSPICERCKNRPSSQAHHLRYKNLFDVTTDDLMAVCDTCHKTIHQGINCGLIINTSDRREAIETTDKAISDAVSKKRKTVLLDIETINRINESTLNIQRRICGVLKKQHPGDFKAWDQIKVTKRRHVYILLLLRKNEFTRRVKPAGKKAARRAKDARRLARILEKQAAPSHHPRIELEETNGKQPILSMEENKYEGI